MCCLLLAGVAREVVEDGLPLRILKGRQTSLPDLLFHFRDLDFPHRRRHRARIVRLMTLATSPQVKLASVAILFGQRLLASRDGTETECRECDGESPGRWKHSGFQSSGMRAVGISFTISARNDAI